MKKPLILGAILSLTLAVTAFADSGTSPKAFWRFDERSGTIAEDSSGNGNNLEGPGSVNWTAGQVKYALSLNGQNAFLKNKPDTGLDLKSFSFVTWLNSDILPLQTTTISSSTPILIDAKYYSLLTNGDAGKRGFAINIKRNFINLTRLDLNEDLTGSAAFQNGIWQLAVITWDNDNNTLSFYKDGALTDVIKVMQGLSLPDKSDRLVVGADLTGSDQVYSGYLDEMRVYDRVLSPAEITEIYSNESPKLSLGRQLLERLTAALAVAFRNFISLFK